MGSVQRLPNGNTAIGWGFADTVGYTEVDSLGNTKFELNFGPGTHSYRVYKFDANYITSGLGGLISATDHDFDTVAIGDTMVFQEQITNTGGAMFTLKSSSQLNDPVDFTMDQNIKFPLAIKPNNSVKINIYFHPHSVGQFSDSILWSTDIIKNADLVIKDLSYFRGYGTVKLGVTSPQTDNTITISPNPAIGNFITISGSALSLIHSLSIHDILGKEMYRKDISGISQYQIPIQDLPNGIYYVNLNSNNGSSTMRFSRVK